MKIVLLLLFDLICYYCAFTQTTEPIIVKTGSSSNEAVPPADLYQYPKFEYGKVFFRNGSHSDARLNYNKFLGEMHFIGMNGDTLTVDNEETVNLVCINSDSFYYDKGYVMLVSNNSLLKLAVKQGFRILDKQKKSAYDMNTSISSIKSVNSFTDEGRLHKVGVTEDVVFTKEVFYYFGDKYNHFMLANKKNLLELLPKHRNAIRQYLKETPIGFDKEADLEKLLRFLALL